jgi:hypothetical protein
MDSRVSTGLVVGDCEQCGTELVLLEHGTVPLIEQMLHPNFRTLGVLQIVQGAKYHPICPSCDAYALGLDLVEPFPVLTQAGKTTTVHELTDSAGNI